MRGTPQLWANRLYALPNPMANEREWRQHAGLDIAEMTVDDLDDEATRLRNRLAYDRRPHGTGFEGTRWMRSRLAKVVAARAAIGAGT